MLDEELKQTPEGLKQSTTVGTGQSMEILFSPRFKSVAAMAGWDEESIVIASLIVEDTPDRDFNLKKRSVLILKTPPSNNSRRKRRADKKTQTSVPVPVLNLDDEEPVKHEDEKQNKEPKFIEKVENKTGEEDSSKQNPDVSCSKSALPCMDKLREELSCAICLDICFEPSTTSCGHSFCKKCLRSAADKCGKRCPKCRQLISNGRSCTVNTVLWNTIQLLFPEEVAARKAAGASNSRETERQSSEKSHPSDMRSRSFRSSGVSTRDAGMRRRGAFSQNEHSEVTQSQQLEDLSRLISRDGRGSGRGRRGPLSQDQDAALALRLQREEFREAFGRNHDQSSRTSVSLARANLRAMASRAMNFRLRGQ
ncbi:hypothetical protein K2173_021007 [Erythroxylum novogranatense]|uniref:RING-type E3 ubiquitin transferase n=1 Tax=Erythroxylum novogranatense TaxID=1862640 RepID=A0AAV8TM97_9ROSI|nr:hypothetical protein K2173_021007 [Erythroxylum novogranatense]